MKKTTQRVYKCESALVIQIMNVIRFSEHTILFISNDSFMIIIPMAFLNKDTINNPRCSYQIGRCKSAFHEFLMDVLDQVACKVKSKGKPVKANPASLHMGQIWGSTG